MFGATFSLFSGQSRVYGPSACNQSIQHRHTICGCAPCYSGFDILNQFNECPIEQLKNVNKQGCSRINTEWLRLPCVMRAWSPPAHRHRGPGLPWGCRHACVRLRLCGCRSAGGARGLRCQQPRGRLVGTLALTRSQLGQHVVDHRRQVIAMLPAPVMACCTVVHTVWPCRCNVVSEVRCIGHREARHHTSDRRGQFFWAERHRCHVVGCPRELLRRSHHQLPRGFQAVWHVHHWELRVSFQKASVCPRLRQRGVEDLNRIVRRPAAWSGLA
mmetsp:Transcript_4368/g.12599  ORF Transcript_4368/g.12599 Transcript_4368/m.12599 type:complete len:272 (-) Transcript_4368:1186-2001(-)